MKDQEKKSVWSRLTEACTFLLSLGSLVLLYEIFTYVKSLIENLD